MTYKELKNSVLRLLDRYSTDGVQVPLSYNCQADDVLRIPALARDGLYYVTTAGKKLRTAQLLPVTGTRGDLLVCDLPEDYYRMAGGLCREDGTPCRGVRMIGGRQLMLPKEEAGRLVLDYYRYPHIPDGWPEDDEDTLDCCEESAVAVSYYVAAHLAMEDGDGMYGMLYGEFERRMAALQEPYADGDEIADVYGW